MKILLTGTRAPATLDLARRLAGLGCEVVGADSMVFPLGRLSNAFTKHIRLPSPRWAFPAFQEKVLQLVDREKITHIWPTCEEVFHLAKFREHLPTPLFPPLPVLERLHHKGKFVALLQELRTSLQAPETWPALGFSQPGSWVWKPNYSRFASRTRFSPPEGNVEGWLAQKRIVGPEICSWAFCVAGEVRLQAVYGAAARAGLGASCAFLPEVSAVSAAATAFTAEIAAKFHYNGSLAFDFITDAQTGETFVLECNPRLTSGIHLLTEWTAHPLETAQFLDQNAAQLFLPTLLYQPSVAGTSPDVVWKASDALPALGQILATAEFAYRSLRHHIPLLEATTWDIEYNGQEF